MKPKDKDILAVLPPEKEKRVKAHIVLKRLQRQGFDWNRSRAKYQRIKSKKGRVKSLARYMGQTQLVDYIKKEPCTEEV
jgi:hypothetical protein